MTQDLGLRPQHLFLRISFKKVRNFRYFPPQRLESGSVQSSLHLTACCSSNTSLDSENTLFFYTSQFCFSHCMWFLDTRLVLFYPTASVVEHRLPARRELRMTLRLQNGCQKVLKQYYERKAGSAVHRSEIGHQPSIRLFLVKFDVFFHIGFIQPVQILRAFRYEHRVFPIKLNISPTLISLLDPLVSALTPADRISLSVNIHHR